MAKNDDTMRVQEAADYLGLSRQYLYQLKHNGKGPKCSKVAVEGDGPGPCMRVLYKKSDLDAWNVPRREKKTRQAKVKAEKVKATKTRKSRRTTAETAEAA